MGLWFDFFLPAWRKSASCTHSERKEGALMARTTTTRKTTKAETKKQPVHELRLGRVKAAIWENGARHNVAFTRLYKQDDVWKDATNFGRDDLPLLIKVSDMAHTWIFAQKAKQD